MSGFSFNVFRLSFLNFLLALRLSSGVNEDKASSIHFPFIGMIPRSSAPNRAINSFESILIVFAKIKGGVGYLHPVFTCEFKMIFLACNQHVLKSASIA